MSRPVVAELGRPETPEETADRKAAASKAYRSSQTVRNLVAALLVTLGTLIVIVAAVPRGSIAEPPPIDLPAVAAEASTAMGRPLLLPELHEGWRVNAAEIVGGTAVVWSITLAPTAQEDRGFLRIGQAFDTDAAWAPTRLSGTGATGTVSVGGHTWDEFVPRDPQSTGNISYALGTQAGRDYVLIYGAMSPEAMRAFAASITSHIDAIAEAQ